MTPQALQGLKVLDFTRVYSGPYCTMLMADLGAEVIKIEAVGRGDDTRAFAPIKNGQSGYFTYLNRSKKSLTLDLKSEEGKKIALDLARWAGNHAHRTLKPRTQRHLHCGREHQ